MEYAIVAVPAAPMRRKPRHQGEMVNQLLFGEMVQILKMKDRLWLKVRSLHDRYEGWMTRNLLRDISKEEAIGYANYVTGDIVNTINFGANNMMIPIGSSLPFFGGEEGVVAGVGYSYHGRVIDRNKLGAGPEQLQQLTRQWLNAPYMWGGRTIFGVDCSGFVQTNFKIMGIDLHRDAWQQAQEGTRVKKLKDAVCGDLAFFDDKDEIVHVGILLNSEQIIHSSGRVRIDSIDKKGIVNSDTGKRTHSLQSIKRQW